MVQKYEDFYDTAKKKTKKFGGIRKNADRRTIESYEIVNVK